MSTRPCSNNIEIHNW